MFDNDVQQVFYFWNSAGGLVLMCHSGYQYFEGTLRGKALLAESCRCSGKRGGSGVEWRDIGEGNVRLWEGV